MLCGGRHASVLAEGREYPEYLENHSCYLIAVASPLIYSPKEPFKVPNELVADAKALLANIFENFEWVLDQPPLKTGTENPQSTDQREPPLACDR